MQAGYGLYVRHKRHNTEKSHRIPISRNEAEGADAYVDWKENGKDTIRKYVLPVEAAVEHLPKIILKDSALLSVANGSPVYTAGIAKISENFTRGDLAAIFSLRGELVALVLLVAVTLGAHSSYRQYINEERASRP